MAHFRAKTAIIMAKCSVSHTEGREFESLRSCQNLGIKQPFDVESGGCCLSDLSAIADYCDSPNLAGREPIVQLSERQAGGRFGN